MPKVILRACVRECVRWPREVKGERGTEGGWESCCSHEERVSGWVGPRLPTVWQPDKVNGLSLLLYVHFNLVEVPESGDISRV
jgi:hypothetical protein